MIFAQLFHSCSDGDFWVILEGSGKPADDHKQKGIVKTISNTSKYVHAALDGDIEINDIKIWKRDKNAII